MNKETDYEVKSAAWKMLDYANPKWQPVDFSKSGKNLQADFKIREDEDAEGYWKRVREELYEKRLKNELL